MQHSTILFDLGSTLVYSKDPWPPFYKQADLALVEALSRAGIEIDPDAFYNEFGGFLRTYYENRIGDNVERTTFSLLRTVLKQKGFSKVPDSILRSALEAMYAVTQENWYLEEDALQTLETLKSRGYRLGLISNTSDDNNFQCILKRWKLGGFFEIILTSAALGIRKPDVRIFQFALERLGVQAEAAVMIGDTLEADVQGANQSGIYSIWITRRVQIPGDGELVIQPQAIITNLSQIPDLLVDLENDLAWAVT
jgi:HAD superfamily hydrolase (TIGR01549 family)